MSVAQRNKSRMMWIREDRYPSWFHARGWITGIGLAGLIAAGALVLSPVLIEPEVEREAKVRLASLGFQVQRTRVEGQDLELWIQGGPGAPAQLKEGAQAAAATTRCDVLGVKLPCAEQVRVHLADAAGGQVKPAIQAGDGANPSNAAIAQPSAAEQPSAAARDKPGQVEKAAQPSAGSQGATPSDALQPDSEHARCQAKLAALMSDETIRFRTASTRIVKESYKLIEKLAQTAAACPGYILVLGHTDNVGKAQSNAWLSRVRAKAVRRALMSRGLPEQKVFAQGKGALEPIASNDTASGRAKNRRIEFRVVPTAPSRQESSGQ